VKISNGSVLLARVFFLCELQQAWQGWQ